MGNINFNPFYFFTVHPNILGNKHLREPQKIAYRYAYEHFILNRKTTDAIIILPTGVGKTGLMGLLPYHISKGRVLIITPQLVIKDSVVGSLDPEYPGNFWLSQEVFSEFSQLPCLIEYDGNKTSDELLKISNVVVINIQKLQSRLMSSLINRVAPNFFDMIIIDEAHHSTATTWLETLQYFSKAKVVKLTGTPYRTDGEKIVGEIVYEYKLSAAMAHEYVKSLENITYIPEQLYLTLDEKEDKLYTVEEIKELGLKDQDWISRSVAYSPACSEKVVIESIKLLKQKLAKDNPVPHKIIAVACSITHAEQIKCLYEKYGYSCAIIHSELDPESKKQALLDIENHRVKVVINVAMLGEGYDHEYLSIAAIFRPFRSLLPYEQFIGRVLRAIPKDIALRANDNVAQVICHKELNLDDLWQYYKKEIQESETIKYLNSLNLEEHTETITQGVHSIDKSIGKATESGTGLLTADVYLDTELLERRKKEEAEDLKKVKALQELLNISAEEAHGYLLQSKAKSLIKRPDLYIEKMRTGVDNRIKEVIVPSLLNRFDLDKSSNDLATCKIFRGKNSWILSKTNNNAGLLAIFINTKLADMIGVKRQYWVLSDWEIADAKLDQIEEYLTKVLEDFLET